MKKEQSNTLENQDLPQVQHLLLPWKQLQFLRQTHSVVAAAAATATSQAKGAHHGKEEEALRQRQGATVEWWVGLKQCKAGLVPLLQALLAETTQVVAQRAAALVAQEEEEREQQLLRRICQLMRTLWTRHLRRLG